MFNTLKKRIKNEKGLSLVELLAVIVILAIVAAIAIPAIGNIINNTRDKAVLSDAQNAIASAKIANADGSCTTAGTVTTCEDDDIEFTSNKFDDYTVTFTETAATAIAPATVTISITATLAEAMSGTRIPEAITEAGATSPGTGTTLTINETQLNEVLD